MTKADRNPNPPFALLYPILFLVVPMVLCLWMIHATHGHLAEHHDATHAEPPASADVGGGR